ncbi:CinA family protein [Candidatus Megaera venefica]|jgi:molybdenum cofactor synthesis domain-containing protein|uniref:CinA family protein n=1 Tax=Candidatus Megaera venefica TaxID=2055910 RepID=A0ABU5NER6_9RICK|nr:competence/damage-inducible protein A [Candidatus Megaera venefica]MEA0971654.1 CinA family protein [Candidatus Megaera venefica]
MSNHTAAVIIIGNEILSGRTLDINTQEIALRLSEIGVSLIETRTIADDRTMIINTARELSSKYNYVFTTGGIGPTHDDITAESMAAAFNVRYVRNDEIYMILKNYYDKMGEKLNSAREKMAYIPESSKLLHNDATMVPGFVIGNVFVMAGIPNIMKAMLKSAIPMLKKGKVIQSQTLEVMMGESKIAISFEELQNKYKEVDMGSYPFTKNGIHGTALVLRSSNYNLLEKAFVELETIINGLK